MQSNQEKRTLANASLLLLALLQTATIALTAQQLSRNSPTPEAVQWLIASSILYLIASFICLKSFNLLHQQGLSLTLILVAALGFRVLLAPVPPAFSDDLLRYRWEGRVQALGLNPYQIAPTDVGAPPDSTVSRIPAADFRAGYGPLLELIQRAEWELASRITSDPWMQARWFKVATCLGDLLALLALCWTLPLAGLPRERILLYAWSPLVVFEFWGMGHNDALVIAFLLLAWGMLLKGRPGLAALLIGCASACKWWPMLLIPVAFPRISRAGIWKPFLALLPPILLFLPYFSDVWGNARFLTGFASGWRNNDVLYGFFLKMAGSGEAAKPWIAATLLLTLLFIVMLRPRFDRGYMAFTLTLLLISANCNVWYLTWLLAFVPFQPWVAILLWSSLAPLLYEPVFLWNAAGIWEGLKDSRWLVHGPMLFWGLRDAERWVTKNSRPAEGSRETM